MRVDVKSYHRAWDFEDARGVVSRLLDWLDCHLELISIGLGIAAILGVSLFLIAN